VPGTRRDAPGGAAAATPRRHRGQPV